MAPTLVRPPPQDTSKALIENALELTELSVIGPDLFTNTRKLWLPTGARGIYGGAVIAQTLAAAQKTVPENFVVHSYHCFFVLAGDSETPILYTVERVREGRSFATRTVQARQKGHAIFTVTCSFVREHSGGHEPVSHATPRPLGFESPPDPEKDGAGYLDGDETRPFETYSLPLHTAPGMPAEEKRSRRWVRARGRITGGHEAHLSALAYISDSYFIGTVAQVNKLWRLPGGGRDLHKLSEAERRAYERVNDFDSTGKVVLEDGVGKPQVGMMVSLDHTIYFHNPKKVRADEWMLTETASPWAGDGRGLVTQRIWSQDGTLLASCFQEGVVRLNDPNKQQQKKAGKKEAKL